MTPEARRLVEAIIDRAGSISAAARMCGVSDRHFQKWTLGHSRPSRASLDKIRLALDGDTRALRQERIERYASRAAQGLSLFS